MIKKILHKLFKTRNKRIENFAGRPYLLLCKKDLEEAMKHYDPNDGAKTHVTMMKED